MLDGAAPPQHTSYDENRFHVPPRTAPTTLWSFDDILHVRPGAGTACCGLPVAGWAGRSAAAWLRARVSRVNKRRARWHGDQ
ncbi:hypothetical protein PSm6_28040 [Pseudomonas solani]|uniref:Uncharacterized protein n=1 Tax=Pseudomonas solani TaxID=2731552 RepID=A0ABM7L9Y9_9PSED|nr:hypothetical protein PSm6_28040 [Pseudomonas solani]